MGSIDFSSARALLRWAHDDIDELDCASIRFLGEHAYEAVYEADTDPGYVTLKVRLPPIPDSLHKLASHALWDIKHSLDHSMRSAVAALIDKDPGEVHFPICSSLPDLNGRLNNPKSRIPARLHRCIKGLEPYKTSDGHVGGDDYLIALSKLANTSKHSIALEAGCTMALVGARGSGRIGGTRIFTPPLKCGENQLAIGVFPREPQANIEFDLIAHVGISGLGQMGAPPVCAALWYFADFAERVLCELEAEAALLTGRMS